MEDQSPKATETLKFLCSYGGKILPRNSDGQLRYVGGFNRVLAVDRSISFAELMVKLGEFCGFSVNLKCQLPNGDLETLVSIKSDEDLANLIEEYDRASALDSTRRQLKVRAILLPRESLKKISPPISASNSVEDFASLKPPFRAVKSVQNFFSSRGSSSPVRFSGGLQQRGSGRVSCYHYHHHHHHEVPCSYYWQ